MNGLGTGIDRHKRAPWALLDELRRVTLEQLSGLPDRLYLGLEGDLRAALEAATSRGLGLGGAQRDDLMQLKLLRQRSASHAMGFREQIGRLFDNFAGKLGDEEDGLCLVSEDELDFRLTVERMVERLAKRFQRPLAVLEPGIAGLATALGRERVENPLSPEQLGSALLVTFREADLTSTLRAGLVAQYQQVLEAELPKLYERTASVMGASELAVPGFANETVERRQHKPEPASTPMPAPVQSGNSIDPAGGQGARQASSGERMGDKVQGGTDAMDWTHQTSADAKQRYDQLRELLQTRRGSAQPAAGSVVSGGASSPSSRSVRTSSEPSAAFQESGPLRTQSARPWVEADALDRVAQLIQAETYEPFERALGGQQSLNEAIREHMGDAALRLGIDLDQSSVSRRDADAIDLVGMLFESLASADDVRPDAHPLFARLVMTYVRIALRDDQLFLRPGHPGKRLIDAVSESVEGNPGVSRQDRDLLDLAREQVDRVAADFNEDLSILEAATNELQPLLQRQRRTRELAERRSRDSAEGRERLQQARDNASLEVVRRVSGRLLAPVVFRFLTHYWRHHYELVLLRAGSDPVRVAKASEIADALLELDAMAAQPDRPEVADRMAELIPHLLQCMSDSGLDRSASDDWLAGIARAFAFPDHPRQAQTLATAPAGKERDSGGNKANPTDVARMGSLRTGDVLRLAEFDGGLSPVKVAWVSDVTGKILLVDRRGQRKLLASPAQLASLLADGRLHMGRDEPPFDRALRGVQERLAQGQSSA